MPLSETELWARPAVGPFRGLNVGPANHVGLCRWVEQYPYLPAVVLH